MTRNLIVVDQPERWSLHVESATVLGANDYLRLGHGDGARRVRVYNLCDSYRYQSTGYYVSLLATARGHRALPSVTTMQDMKSRSLFRPAEELEELIERSLRGITSKRFDLSIYFGRNLAARHARLSRALFNLFPVPLMRASFARSRHWSLNSLTTIPVGDLPESHRSYLRDVLEEHFSARRPPSRASKTAAYDLAILTNNEERSPPSNRDALRRFARAGRTEGFNVEFLGREDFGRVAEFDALFLRETTNVNHHTYRFSSRAKSEGVVVIDDPDSIIRCGNKVYLIELAKRLNVAVPPTKIVDSANVDSLVSELGLPCVLKQPDSAFSEGVFRADTHEELARGLKRLLSRSDLVVAQAFVPTEFDWRVGIIDRKPLFVCRYFMADGHWQIYHHADGETVREGDAETVAVEDTPPAVVRLALRIANAIGDGFYGVDIKSVNGRPVLMEVNDNPNVDHGVEDAILGDELYARVMQVFRRRVDAGKQPRPPD